VVLQDNIPKRQQQYICVLQTAGNIFTVLHSEQIFHLTRSISGVNKAPLQRKKLMVLWWDESWGTLVIINTEHFNSLYGMFYEKYLVCLVIMSRSREYAYLILIVPIICCCLGYERWSNKHNTGFQTLMAGTIQIIASWVLTPCSFICWWHSPKTLSVYQPVWCQDQED
jgi:hypothetical protein